MKQSPDQLSDNDILRGAVIGGSINAVINGALQLYTLWDYTSIPLSVDGITNNDMTVFGTAVPLAVSVAMMLTIVGHLTLKAPKRKLFPDVLWLSVKHGFLAFGLCVSGAVVWQRLMGVVSVSLVTAVIILAVVAGLVGGIVNYMTISASLLRDS